MWYQCVWCLAFGIVRQTFPYSLTVVYVLSSLDNIVSSMKNVCHGVTSLPYRDGMDFLCRYKYLLHTFCFAGKILIISKKYVRFY